MDVTPYLELKIAPRALFDALPERKDRPRFMLPSPGGWRALSWGAFAEQVRAIALFLAASGARPGDRAAIFAPNRVEWLSAALGIQAAGGVMVPIYPASTADQAAYIAEHSDAKVVFVDTAPLLERVLARPAAYRGARIVLLDDALDPGAADALRWSEAVAVGAARHADDPAALDRLMDAVALDQPAVMLYTSGTTGDPKGVPLSHRNVGVNGRDWLALCGAAIDERSVDLLWLPFSHIFGFGEACLGNTLGFTSYLSDPASVMAQLAEVRPNVFMSVPALWDKIAKAASGLDGEARRATIAALTGGRLRFCLSGGAGLARATKELFYGAGVLVIEGYGLTECSPTLTLNRPDAFRFDSVGKPLPSVELRLADDGEILARGESVFSGYHKDEAASREAFTADGWFKTGDVGRFTDDGFLQIVDRKKEILVTAGGKNVPPANIELRFGGDPLIQHAVVYGDGKSYLTAGIWLNPEAVERKLSEGASAAAIARLVAERVDAVNAGLARYEQIKKHLVMDAPLTVARGLLTSTLKVRRKAVYAAFHEAFESMYR